MINVREHRRGNNQVMKIQNLKQQRTQDTEWRRPKQKTLHRKLHICPTRTPTWYSKVHQHLPRWWKKLLPLELPTLSDHLSSPPVFSGVRVIRSVVLCVCFIDRCLSFCPFSFGHCVVCPSVIYGFLLLRLYLQTLLFLY